MPHFMKLVQLKNKDDQVEYIRKLNIDQLIELKEEFNNLSRSLEKFSNKLSQIGREINLKAISQIHLN